MATFAVKEIFKTIQGEGLNAGLTAVFCRFAGCNLWSGREDDRASAICQFCDTDFVGLDGTSGGRFDADALAEVIAQTWGNGTDGRLVVFTGGEPLLQLDKTLIDAIHAHHFAIAVETNGTIAAPAGIDWLCVSPKANAPFVQTSGDELKLVYPQAGGEPELYANLPFRHFLLQPMDGPQQAENTNAAIAYCMDHPQWRLGLQTHKFAGIR